MTTTPSRPSSEPVHDTRLVVLEGMPGSGKTTAASILQANSHHVIGEYTTPAGAVIEIDDHPDPEDDNAHQANWLTKHQLARLLGPQTTVFLDRDWLSALAYAASVNDRELLKRRCMWALEHLRHQRLAVAAHYVLFPLDPATSLARRKGRLTAGHPWSDPVCLQRLQVFYTDPVRAIDQANTRLGHELRAASWHHLPPGHTLAAAATYLSGLADQDSEHALT